MRKGWHQRKHIRKSKKGKKFEAGRNYKRKLAEKLLRGEITLANYLYKIPKESPYERQIISEMMGVEMAREFQRRRNKEE